MSVHSVTKHYRDLPAAHRQPNHDGHCRLIHGHNWGFDVTFSADKTDGNGFVIDVGKLDWLKEFLKDCFDHTLLLNLDDPCRIQLEVALYSNPTNPNQFARVVVVPNCGMEGLAEMVCDYCNVYISEKLCLDWRERSLHVSQVICWEDGKNCSTYKPTRS